MILTFNDGKLVVNIPVSKDGSYWFENERNRVLGGLNYHYLVPEKSIKEDSFLKRENLWSSRRGEKFNSTFKYDVGRGVCYFNDCNKKEITKYKLLQPGVTDFFLNACDSYKSFRLFEILMRDQSFQPYKEIDFILTCEEDLIKRDLLYARHKEFATMYYEIMPNIELKPINELFLSSLEENRENEYKFRIAKENNRVLRLLRK